MWQNFIQAQIKAWLEQGLAHSRFIPSYALNKCIKLSQKLNQHGFNLIGKELS